ncbi:MAG: 30S ribosomal protein S6 [Patescibacteria group bacterium]
MQNYELTFITGEDFKEKTVQKEIETAGGKIIEVKSLGQKDLAYPIKKESRGFYTTVIMTIDPEKVGNLASKLNLKGEILRHIILSSRPGKISKIKEKPTPVKEEKLVQEKETLLAEPLAPMAEVKEIPQEVKPLEKPEKPKVPAKVIKKALPKVTKPPTEAKLKKTEKIQKEEFTQEERLKALDEKLDELLKE